MFFNQLINYFYAQILGQVTTTSITIYYTVYKLNKERNLGMSDDDMCIQYTRKFEL